MKKILSIVFFLLILSSTFVHASMIGNFQQISPAQLNQIKKDLSLIQSIIYPEDLNAETGAIDIDKSWQGIHFFLTGDPLKGEGPLSLAILGGTEIGDEVGYGSVRYLTKAEVKLVIEALSKVTKEDLKARFDPQTMKKLDIYPEIWDDGPGALDYLLEYYNRLVNYYRETAEVGNAMLINLNPDFAMAKSARRADQIAISRRVLAIWSG